jgi:hypothetical protein
VTVNQDDNVDAAAAGPVVATEQPAPAGAAPPAGDASPAGAAPPAGPRRPPGAAARQRRPPEPFAVRARRALTARENRAVVLLGALGIAVLVAFAVYASVAGKADQVEAVVQFAPDATVVQKDAVRSACPTVGRAIEERPDDSTLDTVRTYPLRYDVTEASSGDKAAIYRCVEGRPGVIGISEYVQGG